MDLKVNAQEGLQKIKEILFGDQKKQKFDMTEYKLADGTPIQIDKLAEGGQVMIENSPAPDGEYTLDDGTAVTVINGLIVLVETKEEEAAAPEPAVEPVEAAQAAKPEYMTKADFDNFKNEILSKFVKQTKANVEITKVLDQILKFEVEKPITKQVDFDSMTLLQKRRALKNA